MVIRRGGSQILHGHLKAHTISNKLVSKVSAQKKGEKSYDRYKYVVKFRKFQVESPQCCLE